MVGEIAERLLVGTNAATQVHAIIGNLSLQNASVWPDCAKGVDPDTFEYPDSVEGDFAECRPFETDEGEAAMGDFVRRNKDGCHSDGEICHKQYHYADISIAHDHYDDGFVGARPFDVVRAIVAATEVLKGNPAPTPFDIKDKNEALKLLVHYVGDIHQPLHVGAVYLDASGKRVDPDDGTFDADTATRGGNNIVVHGSKRSLHATWDGVPSSLTASHAGALLTEARSVAPTSGSVEDWPKAWATEAVLQAQHAFSGVRFSSRSTKKRWTATVPSNYGTTSFAIKRTQLTRGGAHLAQLLTAIWP
jgi:hypothetical protein